MTKIMINETLKLALEALEICKPEHPNHTPSRRTYNAAITALRKARAQPEQEPVYVQTRHKEEHGFSDWGSLLDPTHRNSKWAEGVEMRLLYTSPPQRKPLTDEEIYSITGVENRDEMMHRMARNIARAIEAAHDIKDQTRESFEAWFKRTYHSRLDRNMPDKSYNDPHANATWLGWSAAHNLKENT